MYTGITQGLFPVTSVSYNAGILVYKIKLNSRLLRGLALGASIAVDGVCQTVVKIGWFSKEITLQAISETLSITTLGDLKLGQLVSIEKSAKIGQEIGGHEMLGHIHGKAEVIARLEQPNNLRLVLRCPRDLIQYLFLKGSVGLNGSSLTINAVDLAESSFTVDLIPHTLQLTDFGNKKLGDQLNLELDAKIICWVEALKRLQLARSEERA